MTTDNPNLPDKPKGVIGVVSSALLGVRYFMSQCFKAIYHRLVFFITNLSVWRPFGWPLPKSNVKLLILLQCLLYSQPICFGELAGKLNRDFSQLDLRLRFQP